LVFPDAPNYTGKNKVKTINLETQRDRAATKNKVKTINLETQRKRRQQRFLGCEDVRAF